MRPHDKQLGIGIALLAGPMVGAGVCLFVGLALTELSLVYASMALSALGVPAMILGVVLIVRAATRR